MHIAMHDPMNQHHTAVAGPPVMMGFPNVAGTEPSTPRMEIAYETVDHLVNSRRSSYTGVQLAACVIGVKQPNRPACSQCEQVGAHHRPQWEPMALAHLPRPPWAISTKARRLWTKRSFPARLWYRSLCVTDQHPRKRGLIE